MFAAGCSRNQNLLPLESGNRWTYESTAGLQKRIVVMSVAGRAPVGKAEGFRMESALGESTLVWDGGKLLAGKLGNSEFFPPLPLYADGAMEWKGTVRTSGTVESATASLKSLAMEEPVAGKKVAMRVGELTLVLPSGKHEVTTYLWAGRGIYLQEHRVDGRLISRLRYESGP